ncbi:MAG TPA: class I SAM-dependent methyltransferase [Candidatus Acidoferrum sp.]|nr:class I SAM-dependent methyltransferase [Candidatus Acidoferrum sp.]
METGQYPSDLRDLMLALIKKNQQETGFSDDIVEREIAKVLDPNWQLGLFGLIESVIKTPGYFSTPRSIIEVGCGVASLVIQSLQRGHDAWGIDNDVPRLEIGKRRMQAFGLDPSMGDRLLLGDATFTQLPPNSFDMVVGHQFIEHVPDPAGTISEMLRIAKPGGFIVLFAPDYRAPFEAHYEIPWPPFLPKAMCKTWLDGFGRPYGTLETFYYVCVPQMIGILEPLNCRITTAYNDRKIEPQAARHFDCSTLQATFETARKFRAGFEARSLPENFMIATSFGIAAQKL